MAHIEDHDGIPVFVHIVDGSRYSFCARDIPSEQHAWFCSVIGRQMDEIHATAVAVTEKRIRVEIRKALGL
jgi:hypothetical protein